MKAALQLNRDGMLEWINTRKCERISKVTDSETYTLFQMTSELTSVLLRLQLQQQTPGRAP